MPSALDDIFSRFGGTRRVLVVAFTLGIAGLIFVGSRAVTKSEMVPAVSNIPIESASELTARLDNAGVKYTLDQGGQSIMVAPSDLPKARVALAKGGMPDGARPGLELFDRPSWGMNEFTQRINYRRALEGELERTIGRMRGITRAEVHLALPDQGTFQQDARPATASVMLAMRGNAIPNPEVVQGIAHLVSNSVDGLPADNVSIHDDMGRQWTDPNDGNSTTALSSKQLRQQQDVENELQKKAEDLVQGVVGTGNAKVRVSALLNFDKIERTTNSVDPDKQAVLSETKSEIVPQTGQAGASQTNTSNTYENTKSIETFSATVGNIKKLSVAVLVSDRRLPAKDAKDTIPHFQARTAEEMSRVDALVRSAIGIDTTRGDVLSVQSATPELLPVTPAKEPPASLTQTITENKNNIFQMVGLGAAIIIALVALRSLKTPAGSGTTGTPQLAYAGGAPALSSGAAAQQAPAITFASAERPAIEFAQAAPRAPIIFPTANTEVRDKVSQSVDQNPDVAARLVKSWLKDS
jgi:flagellar M-ring protein FliF